MVVYDASERGALQALESAQGADLLVKASGVGVYDDLLEEAVADARTLSNVVAFWDVDAPATLERVHGNPGDPIRASDSPVRPGLHIRRRRSGGLGLPRLGARQCVPIYNALDPETHHPVPHDDRFAGDLGFLGNRLPDRERRVEEFFLKPAARMGHLRFLLGGAGWGDKPMSPNVKYFDHVYTRDHNAFNCSPGAVLNISRDSMAQLWLLSGYPRI